MKAQPFLALLLVAATAELSLAADETKFKVRELYASNPLLPTNQVIRVQFLGVDKIQKLTNKEGWYSAQLGDTPDGANDRVTFYVDKNGKEYLEKIQESNERAEESRARAFRSGNFNTIQRAHYHYVYGSITNNFQGLSQPTDRHISRYARSPANELVLLGSKKVTRIAGKVEYAW